MKSERIALLKTSDENTFIMGLACADDFKIQKDLFGDLDDFIFKHKGSYLFTCLSYDLKNRVENLESHNKDLLEFPELLCWKAKLVIEIKHNNYQILEGAITSDFEKTIQNFIENTVNSTIPALQFTPQTTKENYLKRLIEIKKDIQLGNVYELNYCQNFTTVNCPDFDSFSLFKQMLNVTKAPFSAYVNIENHEIFCASPERFLQKKGKKLLSQPIKGTSSRGETEQEDEALKNKLQNDPKERAENIMITDLVRNDFSKIAQKKSVNVDELCQLYTFGTVHQLISSISCELKDNISFSEILKATFPMGSMTGAPKIAAMGLIENYEEFKRGIYSGSIGYIAPNGDFDLNVVIRTLILNKQTRAMSASVGGAITIKSDPEAEYEECLVKIQKILNLFQND